MIFVYQKMMIYLMQQRHATLLNCKVLKIRRFYWLEHPVYRPIPGGLKKNGTVDFLGLCSDQQLSVENFFYFMSNFLWTVIFGICH